jgi:hypothetical protein
MDYLAIRNFFLAKRDQPQPRWVDRSWHKEYELD